MLNERLFVKDVMENVVSFESLMQNFSGLKYEKSFANNETVKKPLRSKGLVSTYDVLDSLAEYGEAVNNIPEFLEEYGNMEILQDSYDNSYNYNGYLDRYVNFSIFELENDQVLVTLSICLGLDPRGGYTDSVALIFESEEDFLEEFSKTYELLDFEFTAFGSKKFYASFDAEALSEFGYLNIIDQQTEETFYYDEVALDTVDIDDIKETLAEIVETEDVIIDKINYFWES